MTISHHSSLGFVGASFVYDAVQGSIREKVYSPPRKREDTPPKRGRVQGISKRSARRLARKGVSGRPRAMVTLTYPADFPTCEQAKRHLRAFIKRLFRKLPRIGVLWRLEIQKRGAPHFHLLIQGVFAVPFLRVVAARAWIEGTRRWGIKHNHLKASYRHGVKVDDLMSGDRKEAFYIAKYISKSQFWPKTGRMWGKERWREYHEWVFHVKHFPGHRIYRILETITGEYGPVWTITRGQYRMLRRALVDEEYFFGLTRLSMYRCVYINGEKEPLYDVSDRISRDCVEHEAHQHEDGEGNAHCDSWFHGRVAGFFLSRFDDSGCFDGAVRQGVLQFESGVFSS